MTSLPTVNHQRLVSLQDGKKKDKKGEAEPFLLPPFHWPRGTNKLASLLAGNGNVANVKANIRLTNHTLPD